ncbi:hypothetical protein FNF28_03529 [Cafeteria roenbergensis]|uniref:AAA+ ATPase domain-containing protein n=1 Tax=Cafeteria roenbergensis TaxID=33653 RepID=A0A5A8DJ68_CAFRO|nr:hypothetical protein FNF28_03529 [Cafeteria roenbergensis]
MAGDRRSLSRAITLIESSREEHRRQAELLLDAVLERRRSDDSQSAAAKARATARAAAEAAAAAASAKGSTGAEAMGAAAEAAVAAEAALDSDLARGPATRTEEESAASAPAASGADGGAASELPSPPAGPGGEFHGGWPSTLRVGIAGPPGAGKSTLIEALGQQLCAWGHRVAVLAIDPSSTRTGGSILGDRTRMTELSRNRRAYVRPSPTRGALGGVAAHTNDVVLLCEAAGFDIVLVETVGLGQSEVAVDATVDCLALVLPPAGGDELQGVKKGIMECADIVAVNKADGDMARQARLAALEYKRALTLIPPKHPMTGWRGEATTVSALQPDTVATLWSVVTRFRAEMTAHGEVRRRRAAQAGQWLWSQLEAQALERLRKDRAVVTAAAGMLGRLSEGSISPRRAAHVVLENQWDTGPKAEA